MWGLDCNPLELNLFGNFIGIAQLTFSLLAFKCRIYNGGCIRAREQMSQLHQTSSVGPRLERERFQVPFFLAQDSEGTVGEGDRTLPLVTDPPDDED